MPDYSIYGVRLRTNTRLPATSEVPCEGAADVVVELAGVDDPSSMPAPTPVDPSAPPSPFVRVRDASGEYVRINYEGAGHHVVFLLTADGTRVWVRWNALVGLEDVTALLTGPILSCILRLRGLTCLHASVVEIDRRAIALLGSKGAGKSTTALALVRAGARLVSDDVAVIEHAASGFTVRAGHAGVRMRPAPAAALCTSFDALQPLWSREEARPAKRYLGLSADDSASAREIPLAAIYSLGRRDLDGAVRIESVPAAGALPLLMANRHMAEIVERSGHVRDFRLLAEVVRHVPVRTVERTEGLDHLQAVVEAIHADLAVHAD